MMMKSAAASVLLSVVLNLWCSPLHHHRLHVEALENGLALTPPMGWLSWERFRCDLDCQNDPENCISEKLYMDMADRLAADGWKELGYEYVNIDDCWSAKSRDSSNRLVADPDRFPHGIKWLADYVHAKGLKLGLYGDFGSLTCGGYPGSEDFLEIDAKTLAEWGVDSWKMDGCNVDINKMATGYPQMAKYLNATGRPILYSCSWPAYTDQHITTDWQAIKENCNLWRLFDDIQDDWDSVVSIIKFMFDNQAVLQPLAGPGHWNDPDMVICGDFALSHDECRAHFAVWAVLAAPLYMSNDLRTLSDDAKAILQNPEVIAVDQDPLGVQGLRMAAWGAIQMFARPLANGDLAVVLFNNNSDMPSNVTISWKDLGLWTPQNVRDLYARKNMGLFANQFSTVVNPHGGSIFRFSEVQMM